MDGSTIAALYLLAGFITAKVVNKALAVSGRPALNSVGLAIAAALLWPAFLFMGAWGFIRGAMLAIRQHRRTQ